MSQEFQERLKNIKIAAAAKEAANEANQTEALNQGKVFARRWLEAFRLFMRS